MPTPRPALRHRTRPVARAAVIAVCATLTLTLAGCAAASPTTTYTDASGQEVTVDWSDYPAHAGIDADAVLEAPVAEDVEARWEIIRAAVVDAIDVALDGALDDASWSERGDGGWTDEIGNGYGGQSMLSTYNSGSWEAEIVLPREDWDRVIAAAQAELAEWGITGVGPEPTEVPEWLDYGDFFEGPEFVSVAVQDASLDADAHSGALERGWLVSGISLFYGIQTISEADRAAFTAAAAPFAGLERPEPTSSD
ncbi:hypothetical protein GCM10022200_00640 [Microbacterium awajiense]|uniref:Uncharacterized protein n=1 Tax=Microbacterium awajiense TaxID=415214 RepID=A0ABP7A119_9MICO